MPTRRRLGDDGDAGEADWDGAADGVICKDSRLWRAEVCVCADQKGVSGCRCEPVGGLSCEVSIFGVLEEKRGEGGVAVLFGV